MQSVDFDRLRLRLLKGGVAPKFVTRTIQELRQHLEDLTAQEKVAGISETEARAIAINMLGDEDKLVNEALAKKEIQSWPRRYPRSFFLLVPLVAYFVCMFAIYLLGDTFFNKVLNLDVSDGWTVWHLWVAKALLFLVEYLLTPLLAAVIVVTAIKRNVQLMWPFIGILILCFFGLGIETGVDVPDERARGDMFLLWGWPFLPWEDARPPIGQSLEQFLRVIVTMTMVVFAFKRYRPYERAN